MSDVVQEVIAVVFLLLFWVKDILTVLTNVINGTLYHACSSDVLRECFPPVDVAFSCNHGAIHVVLLGVLALLGVKDVISGKTC